MKKGRIVLALATLCCCAALMVGCGGNENKEDRKMTNVSSRKGTEVCRRHGRQHLLDKNKHGEECLICGAPLEYLAHDTMMECVLCHRQEPSKTRCAEGHYVCSDCHTAGMDSIIALCLAETSKDPIAILEKMMSQPFCHMHGPEHHVLVGAALLTAYSNAVTDDGMKVDLALGLTEVMSRGRQVPGGACGYMGACGASISAGIFMSVVTRNTPLSADTWRLCNLCTARALEQVALNGGPRCCKRDSYLSILSAVDFVKEHLGVEMEKPEVKCSRSQINNQCIGKRCPFSPES